MTPDNQLRFFTDRAVKTLKRDGRDVLPGGRILNESANKDALLIQKHNGEIVEANVTLKTVVDQIVKERETLAEITIALAPALSRVPKNDEGKRGGSEEGTINDQRINEAQATRFWVDGNVDEMFRLACAKADQMGYGSKSLARMVFTHIKKDNSFSETDVKTLSREISRYFPANFTTKSFKPKKPSL